MIYRNAQGSFDWISSPTKDDLTGLGVQMFAWEDQDERNRNGVYGHGFYSDRP